MVHAGKELSGRYDILILRVNTKMLNCKNNTRLTFAGKSDTSLDDRFFFLIMLSFGCTDDVLTSHLLEYVFYKLSNEPTQRALRRSVRAL